MANEEDLPSLTIPSYPHSGVRKKKKKKSEILYGIEKAVGRGIYFMSNVKERMDIFIHHKVLLYHFYQKRNLNVSNQHEYTTNICRRSEE